MHLRLRKGAANSARELTARLDRAGASGLKLLRADSAYWNHTLIARLQRAGWTYSIGVRTYNNVKAQIAVIAEDAWTTLADYPDSGEVQIAETVPVGRRMIVRRTRLIGAQAELWPDWRHFAFVTNRTEAIEIVEAEHRQHAVVEQAIRHLKDQASRTSHPAITPPTPPGL